MTGWQALLRLEEYGYCFMIAPDGKIKVIPPGTSPADADSLLEDLRIEKDAAAHLLKQRTYGATVVREDEQVTKTENFVDVKALKLALDAGEIDVRKIVFHKTTGLMEAYWTPLMPLPFLDLVKYRQAVVGRMEALDK